MESPFTIMPQITEIFRTFIKYNFKKCGTTHYIIYIKKREKKKKLQMNAT